MKIREVKELVDRYGSCVTLGQLLTKIQGNKLYECPKCKGNGFITIEYNGIPSWMDRSGGFDYKAAYKDEKCDLCGGEGYTDHEYKPRMVQEGWE